MLHSAFLVYDGNGDYGRYYFEHYTTLVTMITTNPKELTKINSQLTEISNLKSKIELHQESIKEIVGAIHDEFGMEKSLIRKLAKVYHARNFIEEVAAQDDFVDAYEQLVAVNNRLASP